MRCPLARITGLPILRDTSTAPHEPRNGPRMSDLHARSAAAGLHPHWHDITGRWWQVDDQVLAAILDRLDTSPPELPFLSGEAGAPIHIPARGGQAELLLEDGSSHVVTIDDGGFIPGVDAIGYHSLIVGGRRFDLAVAPPHCPPPPGRGWGVSVQIPSLRGAAPSAFGDFGTLADTARAFGRAGCNALAISPTHALFPADPGRFSPYSPSSRSFHNALLADASLIDAPPPAPFDVPGDLIDWATAWPARLRHLRSAYDGAGDAVLAAVAAYRRRMGQLLEDHARFDALHAHLGGGGWPDWPAPYRDPRNDAVQRFAAEHAADVGFHVFLQWLADISLANTQAAARETMSIGLIADLAVGMNGSGSHGWSRRDDLLSGLSIGAPPDPLGPVGQNWGITTLDPFALARAGFRPFIETIRAALAHAGGIRIDHALGLERLWVIPQGAPASDGAYLTMPGTHLKRIVAIEAHRARAIVIAEDLGTVPAGFREDMAGRGMLGMQVLLFERDHHGFIPPARWHANAVAMTGTHDTPTMAGWWHGRDLDWRRRLGHTLPDDADTIRAGERASLWHATGGHGDAPPDPPLDQIIAAVSAAPAPLIVVPLEDLLGTEEQPNIPGTVDEHPNWRRRMPADAATLLAQPSVAARAAILNDGSRH